MQLLITVPSHGSHCAKAFGSRLQTLATVRKQYDPTDRLLNSYFKSLLT